MHSEHCRGILGAASLLLLILPVLVGAEPRTWAVTILGPADDSRLLAVTEAIEYWNEQLVSVNSSLRLGPISRSDERIADDLLRGVSDAALERRRIPALSARLQEIPGDVLVILAGTDLISVGFPPGAVARQGTVIIRSADGAAAVAAECGAQSYRSRAGPHAGAAPQQ
jgi:hypothetical protein